MQRACAVRGRRQKKTRTIIAPFPFGAGFWSQVQRQAMRRGYDRDALLRRARLQETSDLCGQWPQRDVVLRLCLALQLESEAAQQLLRLSGNLALDAKLLRDAAIVFALGKHWNVAQTQALLKRLNVCSL